MAIKSIPWWTGHVWLCSTYKCPRLTVTVILVVYCTW